ncbi:MAG: sugar ABC transporter permease [Lachnospiraceae bacterium]|nr:sugar ABC transporter permease [Lachnospiraceae bacterium]
MTKKTKMKNLIKQLNRCKMLYLMILPAIVAVFIFHYIPLYGVQIAFKDYRSSLGIVGSEWVGLKHFKNFINYPYFGKIMINTLRINLLSLTTFPLPIIFSLMLNELRNEKFKKVCQMITYAPHFVSTVVVCSMVILFTNRNGLINIIIRALGGEVVDYMAVPEAFAPIYVISGLWSSLGWGTIIYMAALSGVSPELIDAARIDGAGRMQVVWHVQIPHIVPTVVTMFILQIGSLVGVGFEKVFALQNNLNMEASSVISTYTYQVGLIQHQFSYSSAIGLFNNFINVILILLANQISKKVAKVSLW